jgi:hypothetical protein
VIEEEVELDHGQTPVFVLDISQVTGDNDDDTPEIIGNCNNFMDNWKL